MWLSPPDVDAALGPLTLPQECHLPVTFTSVISGPQLKSLREQRSRTIAVMGLDFLSQLECLYRSLLLLRVAVGCSFGATLGVSSVLWLGA